MEYKFFDRGDDELIATSELPCDKGISLAVRTTGYEHGSNEVIELAICDLDGNGLFSQRVKPQNVEEWQPDGAAGGISPADVAEAPELYQFVDEITELFEGAGTVIAPHLPFVEDAIESSWVSLPKHEGTDLVELFRQTHATMDHPSEPATTASLPEIAAYYGLGDSDGTVAGEAALTAACFRALVSEHASERAAKGDAYWQRYEEGKAGERAEEARKQAVIRMREHRFNQMNGLLWIAGAIIFVSLAIQLQQRGGDIGIMVIAIVIATFCAFRGFVNFRK